MLNAAQVARRAGKLTASRIACLMTSDKQKIDRLYREFIGEELPEDLDDNFQVQLGIQTEPLNLRWYERKSKHRISRQGDFVVHPYLPWAGATLDGWIDELQCPIECKHNSVRFPIEVLIERYYPQCQWQMECSGADQCALSIVRDNADPDVRFIERDAGYAAEMRTRGAQFIAAVKLRQPPVELDPVPLPVDVFKTYDMEGSNSWASSAVMWLESREAAQAHEDAGKILKSLVPIDAKKAHGHGVQITRSVVGYLSLREKRA